MKKTTSAKKTSAKKTSAKKTSAKKTNAKKTNAKKTSAKKTSAKKTSAKQASAKKTSAKQASAKKATAKQASAKKTSAKQASAKKATAKKKTSAKKATAKKKTSAKLDLTPEQSEEMRALKAMSPRDRTFMVHLAELITKINKSTATYPSAALELRHFIGSQLGRDNDFYLALKNAETKGSISAGEAQRAGHALWNSMISGRFRLRSIRAEAEAEVTGDILTQADRLLSKKGVHHAAAVVLVGASLEEFLRTWCQRRGIMPTAARPGIEHYKGSLRKNDLISENEAKDITSWAGKRNSVAHGRFDEVGREEARLMLEMVRAFMRKHE